MAGSHARLDRSHEMSGAEAIAGALDEADSGVAVEEEERAVAELGRVVGRMKRIGVEDQARNEVLVEVAE